ncbi:MAG: response regulator [Polyangiales bacterium]
MLVEDNEDHAVLVKKTLASAQIPNEVKVFETAEYALRYLKDHRHAMPQVILLDINLPAKSGLELLEDLKKDPTLKRIPVVILSTSDADVDRLLAYELGANSYLTKPVDFHAFRRMIKDFGDYWGKWNRSVP